MMPGYFGSRALFKKNIMTPIFTYNDFKYNLMVINPKGCLREIYCPFKVQCIKAINSIPENSWVFVEMISNFQGAELLYLINGRWYSFESFVIIIHF